MSCRTAASSLVVVMLDKLHVVWMQCCASWRCSPVPWEATASCSSTDIDIFVLSRHFLSHAYCMCGRYFWPAGISAVLSRGVLCMEKFVCVD